MDRDKNIFIERYLTETIEGNTAIFAGAGLSIPAGYVDWKTLVKPLADELGLDIDRETDLISLAQFHVNDHGRHRLNQEILNRLGRNAEPTENHKILSRLPIKTYWTTNYDKLIEKSLEKAGKNPDVKHTVNQLAQTRRSRDAIVYKMHGDVDHPDNAVVTKDDYERYYLEKGPFVNALSGDLISKTFLFIGFSMTDPNLDYILGRIRIHFKEHQRQHYCIFKKVQKADYSDESEFTHDEIRQKLLIKDLQRFNIKTLLIEDYEEVTQILSRIEKMYKRNTIFLSGSAHDFAPWARKEVEQFLYALGEVLIDKGFKIVSGIGLGIGNAFITGAIKKIYEVPDKKIDDYAVLRPFPQFIDDEDERKKTWSNYRRELLERSGILIIFMGNKLLDGDTVLADGVEEEFQIAKELGLSILPIGASGWMAKELWDRVIDSWEGYFPNGSKDLKKMFEELGKDVDKPIQLLSKITETLEQIIKE